MKDNKRSKVRIGIDVLIIVFVAIATLITFKFTRVKSENQEKNNPDVAMSGQENDKEVKFDLNPVISSWMTNAMRDFRQSVAIYDLDNQKMVGTLDEKEVFPMESLYKLFAAYEGYRRVDAGTLDGGAESAEGMTVNECLDIAIRKSNSACAENLVETHLGGWDDLDMVIRRDWGLTNTSVSDLTTTAEDMILALKKVYEHKELSEASWGKLKDSMLNQPLFEDPEICEGQCDLRGGLPAGFTQGTLVYAKVGWRANGTIWSSYNDVAILEFPQENRHFAIVLLTQKHSTKENFTELGRLVEEAIIAFFRYE